jgi:Holliday junction resolvasome RuvABC endonuclease subunit
VIGHFTITKDDFAERLVEIRNTVIKLIEEHDIDTVAFEDIQLQNNVVQNVKTFKMLAEVFGVILELLQERKIKYHIVAPIVWKATFKIAGKGREAEKKLAQQYILNEYGIKCTQDEADAACIGVHVTKNTIENFDWA